MLAVSRNSALVPCVESGELLLAFAVIAVAPIASGQSPIVPRGTEAWAINDSVSFDAIVLCVPCFAGLGFEQQWCAWAV